MPSETIRSPMLKEFTGELLSDNDTNEPILMGLALQYQQALTNTQRPELSHNILSRMYRSFGYHQSEKAIVKAKKVNALLS
jgi:hypothetical protein